MINLWKINSILFGMSLSTVIHAQPMFTITPDSNSIIVSGSSSQNYVLGWTVKNNLNKSTPIVLSDWGGNLGVSTISGTDECSTTQVPSGGTCTISMGIKGAELSNNNVQISPKFCTPDYQLCSQASFNNRLSVSRTTSPTSPNGTWRVFSNTPTANFPEFITINYPKIVLGVINNNYSPTVYQCPNINSDYNCSGVDLINLISFDFLSITNLSFSPSGTLYGVFKKPLEDASINMESYILNIPNGSNSWQQSTSHIGTTEGLDTNSTLGVLLSTGLYDSSNNSIGSAYLLNANTVVSNAINEEAANLSSIVDDGLGHIYVAGLLNGDASTIELFSRVWLWNRSNNTYSQITMPEDILLITSMVSDGKGTIYISGLDSASNGRVWSYSHATNQFLDTGLSASSITTLFYSPYGYLLAGGIDNADYNGAIWFYTNGSWTNMNLNSSVSGGSTNVASITADANNDVVATGYNLQNTPTIWVFN